MLNTCWLPYYSGFSLYLIILLFQCISLRRTDMFKKCYTCIQSICMYTYTYVHIFIKYFTTIYHLLFGVACVPTTTLIYKKSLLEIPKITLQVDQIHHSHVGSNDNRPIPFWSSYRWWRIWRIQSCAKERLDRDENRRNTWIGNW